MKAVIFDRAGEPEQVLRLGDRPEPEACAEHVLIRVTARPIQPADFFFIRDRYRFRPSFPQVAGLEGVGVVVNGGGSRFPAGSRVAFRWPGTWAEQVTIPQQRLVPVPDDVPDEVACQISLNPLTAWALLNESEAQVRDWIVLTAGTSTVSNLVAAVARSRGIYTVGIVRGNVSEAASRAAADHILSAQDPQLISKIIALTDSNAVALLDSVGGPIVPALFPALKPGARVIAYGVQDSAPAEITNAMLIYSNLVWKGFGVDRWLSMSAPGALERIFGKLWCLVREGTLPLPVDSTFSLGAFREGLAAAANARRGKVLLV